MKKFLDTTVTTLASTGILATAGLLYASNKELKFKEKKDLNNYLIESRKLELEENQFELEKFKLGIDSKFKLANQSPKKLDTPVSDHLNNISQGSTNVNTNIVPSPFEGDATYISTNIVNLAGIALICFTVCIILCLISLYLNTYISKFGDKHIYKAPVLIQKLYPYYSKGLTYSNKAQLTLIVVFSIINLSIALYLTMV